MVAQLFYAKATNYKNHLGEGVERGGFFKIYIRLYSAHRLKLNLNLDSAKGQQAIAKRACGFITYRY